MGAWVKKAKGLSKEKNNSNTDNTAVITRGKGGGGWEKRVRGGGRNVLEGNLTLGGNHTIQYTDDVLQNWTPETSLIVLTHIIPINSINTYHPNKFNTNFLKFNDFTEKKT